MAEKVEGTKTKVSAVKIIDNALRSAYKYTYKENLNLALKEECNRTLNRAEFFMQVNKQGWTNSDEAIRDAFLLEALNTLGHATVDMVSQYLLTMHRLYPDKLIPYCDEKDWQVRHECIRKRLRSLCSRSAAVCRDYVAANRSVIEVFTLTPYGWSFAKGKIDNIYGMDDGAIFREGVEMFKRMSAFTVALSVMGDKRCTGYVINGRSSNLPKEKQKSENGYIYSFCQLREKEREITYIIEPVFYSFDARVTTKEEHLDRMRERFKALEAIYSDMAKKLETEMGLIIVVEDRAGLDMISEYVANNADSELFENVIFTSENVFYVTGNNVDVSFLKMVLTEEKIKFKAAGKNWV